MGETLVVVERARGDQREGGCGEERVEGRRDEGREWNGGARVWGCNFFFI
jgi:hypothetical protein